MEAIPRGLVSRDMIKMIPGIKCLRTNILPSHHSGNHQFTSTASNKLTFQIPSFPNSYINTKRSFIRFVLKTSANGVLVPQANPFRRLLLKSSRGQVLECEFLTFTFFVSFTFGDVFTPFFPKPVRDGDRSFTYRMIRGSVFDSIFY